MVLWIEPPLLAAIDGGLKSEVNTAQPDWLDPAQVQLKACFLVQHLVIVGGFRF